MEWFLDLVDGISLEPVLLSLELAFVTTCILLVLGLPLAWWLARARSRWWSAVNAVVTLPLVLPPSVLGFPRPRRTQLQLPRSRHRFGRLFAPLYGSAARYRL